MFESKHFLKLSSYFKQFPVNLILHHKTLLLLENVRYLNLNLDISLFNTGIAFITITTDKFKNCNESENTMNKPKSAMKLCFNSQSRKMPAADNQTLRGLAAFEHSKTARHDVVSPWPSIDRSQPEERCVIVFDLKSTGEVFDQQSGQIGVQS